MSINIAYNSKKSTKSADLLCLCRENIPSLDPLCLPYCDYPKISKEYIFEVSQAKKGLVTFIMSFRARVHDGLSWDFTNKNFVLQFLLG